MQRFPAWEELYRERSVEGMPWFYAEIDPDLASALDRLALTSGKALDLGTGPATQAIALAKRGLDVTATDLSSAALELAKERAAKEGVEVRFQRDDILASTLAESFDVVFDRGCFHVIDPDKRAGVVATLAKLVRPRGYLFLKTFSEKQPGTFGPHRFAPDEIDGLFRDLFEVESIAETIYQGQLVPPPIALFAVLRRR